jgi:hypothetical protein
LIAAAYSRFLKGELTSVTTARSDRWFSGLRICNEAFAELARPRSDLPSLWYNQKEDRIEGCMEMTAAKILQLNGNMRDSPLMEVVRRFHALSISRELPYCVVGGMAVIRNGYARTTMDVDILTFKKDWRKLLPLEGEISSEGPENCVDKKTGVTIDILFADGDWQMPIGMPDPRKVGEYDLELGACFIGLHALVQLKTAVYLDKLREQGEDVASKDRSDVYELISRNLPEFSKEVIQTYDPAVKKHCMKAFETAVRASKSKIGERRNIGL